MPRLSPVASSHPLGAKRQQVTLERQRDCVPGEEGKGEREREGDESEMGERDGLHINI